MKKYFLLLTLFFVSCDSSIDSQDSTNNVIDSVILESQQHLQNSDLIQKKSDSITRSKVSSIVKEVEKFRLERFVLLNQLRVAKQNYIVRVDTVFIETKKNFWGREKRSVTIKSDSLQIESSDSSSVEQSIDTTKNQ